MLICANVKGCIFITMEALGRSWQVCIVNCVTKSDFTVLYFTTFHSILPFYIP